MEVLVAILVLTTMGTAFYVGLSSCFSVLRNSREDVRATQIMMQKLEAVRLCTWSELTNFSFRESYDPTSTSNSAGIYYYGTVTKSTPTGVPNTSAYYSRLCLVTVNLSWTNFSTAVPQTHSRQMQTHFARYGLQNYIWGAIQ